VVRPHEQTFAHHKRDRLELTRRTKANLSAIFGLYGNAEFHVEPEGGWSEPPEIDVMYEGVRNRLWLIRSSEARARISAAVKNRTVFIADGHHRYETALNYYAATHAGSPPPEADDAPGDRENPAAHVMAFLATFEDPGMLVLPTHRELPVCSAADAARFLGTIEKEFQVEALERSPVGRQRVMELLASGDTAVNLFVVAFSTRPAYYVLRRNVPRNVESAKAALDVTVLHASLLTQFGVHDGPGGAKVEYSPDTEAVLARVESGRSAAAFLMRALRPEQMAAVCAHGELLPQKSTFFYPKLLTGLVFHTLEP
jgi:uncharacterized protein (DUF1015 family)